MLAAWRNSLRKDVISHVLLPLDTRKVAHLAEVVLLRRCRRVLDPVDLPDSELVPTAVRVF